MAQEISLIMSFWKDKRVVGDRQGRTFLGTVVVDQLPETGLSKHRRPTDLTDLPWTWATSKAVVCGLQLLIWWYLHLAARVGGIRANQTPVPVSFYDNLMMELKLIGVGPSAGVKKFRGSRNYLFHPKYTWFPSGRGSLEWLSEETNRSLRLGEEDDAGPKRRRIGNSTDSTPSFCFQ